MARYRRSLYSLAVLILALSFVAACGSDDDDAPATSAATTAATTAATSAATTSGSTPASSGGSSASGSVEGRKIAVLFPGLVDDGSWNQYGYEGLKQLEEQGAEIAYTEQVTQDKQLEVFRNYAQQGYDVVLGHGGEYVDSALTAASEFPDTEFVVTNGNQGNGSNMTSLTFNYGDAGFLAGTLAGLMTETNKIALVAGEEIPIVLDALRGFEAGAKLVNPDVTVDHTITGAWADVDKAREASLALINNDTDVLWHVLDAADAGVFSAADDEGVMAIGLMGDQSRLGPDSYLGSALFDPAALMHKALAEDMDGGVHSQGIVEGAVSMGAFSDNVPQDVQDKIQEAIDGLMSGELSY